MILGETRKRELASQGSRTGRCTVEAERGTGQGKARRRSTGGLAFLGVYFDIVDLNNITLDDCLIGGTE